MYEITKLDVNRIYRYLDKYTEKMDAGIVAGVGISGSGGGGGSIENDLD